jgi:hypothetical protein
MQDPRHVVEGREHDQEILGGGGGEAPDSNTGGCDGVICF